MGLDIYLYHVTAPRTQIEAENERWDAEDSRILALVDTKAKAEGRTDKWNDEDRAENKRLEAESAPLFGRVVRNPGDSYIIWDNQHERCIELDSTLYPDHLFKIGYFRSSYNSGGIHHILEDHLNTSLEDLMGRTNDDWQAARERISGVLVKMRELDAATKYRAIEIDVFSPFHEATISNPAEAIAAAAKVIGEHPPRDPDSGFGNDFSSRDGLFLLDSKPQFIAFIAGKNCLHQPTVFGIVEAKPGDVFGWYIKALEIMVETCDWVLATGKTHEYVLHWSG